MVWRVVMKHRLAVSDDGKAWDWKKHRFFARYTCKQGWFDLYITSAPGTTELVLPHPNVLRWKRVGDSLGEIITLEAMEEMQADIVAANEALGEKVVFAWADYTGLPTPEQLEDA